MHPSIHPGRRRRGRCRRGRRRGGGGGRGGARDPDEDRRHSRSAHCQGRYQVRRHSRSAQCQGRYQVRRHCIRNASCQPKSWLLHVASPYKCKPGPFTPLSFPEVSGSGIAPPLRPPVFDPNIPPLSHNIPPIPHNSSLPSHHARLTHPSSPPLARSLTRSPTRPDLRFFDYGAQADSAILHKALEDVAPRHLVLPRGTDAEREEVAQHSRRALRDFGTVVAVTDPLPPGGPVKEEEAEAPSTASEGCVSAVGAASLSYPHQHTVPLPPTFTVFISDELNARLGLGRMQRCALAQLEATVGRPDPHHVRDGRMEPWIL